MDKQRMQTLAGILNESKKPLNEAKIFIHDEFNVQTYDIEKSILGKITNKPATYGEYCLSKDVRRLEEIANALFEFVKDASETGDKQAIDLIKLVKTR